MSSVRDRVVSILKNHVKAEESQFVDEADLAKDLGVDSLTLFELILDMEKEFGCEIPEKEATAIVSIGSAVSYIESKIADGSAH